MMMTAEEWKKAREARTKAAEERRADDARKARGARAALVFTGTLAAALLLAALWAWAGNAGLFVLAAGLPLALVIGGAAGETPLPCGIGAAMMLAGFLAAVAWRI